MRQQAIFFREMEVIASTTTMPWIQVIVKGSQLSLLSQKDCFYPQILLSSCIYKNAEFCDVALLFSAKMQMIVPRILTHACCKTKNAQVNKEPRNNKARTIAPTGKEKFDRHVFLSSFPSWFDFTTNTTSTRTFPETLSPP